MSVQEIQTWQNATKIPTLSQSEIHVWRVNLIWKKTDGELEKILTEEECGRAGRFHFAQDQKRFVKRRAILRNLLATYLGSDAKTIRLSSAPDGKPFISDQSNPAGIRFNCSHSDDCGLIAVARGRELGVDLEQHRPLAGLMDLANNYFSQNEINELMKVSETMKTQCFFDAWTRKEAFIKATGRGLSFPLQDFSVSFAPGQPAKLLDVKNDPNAAGRWQMSAINVRPHYSAALVFEGGAAKLRCFDWDF